MNDSKKQRRELAERIYKAIPPGAELTDDEIVAMVTMFIDSKKAQHPAQTRQDSGFAVQHSPVIDVDGGQLTRLELTSGYYEAAEILEIIKATAARRDEMWENAQDDERKLIGLAMELESRIAEISGFVRGRPGNLWATSGNGKRVYPYSEADAGRLGDLYIQIRMLLESMGIPKAIDSFLQPAPFISGIGNLITGHDNGDSLRQAAADYIPRSAVTQPWLASVRKPGRRNAEITTRLLERAAAYQGVTVDDRYSRLLDETTDAEELEYLETWNLDAFTKAFSRKYGKRRKSAKRT
jgi:hypothetical protein